MANELQTKEQTFTLADISKMGEIFTRSGLFGYSKPEEAMALMLQAQADGIHPAKAAQQYHIIKGRPSLKSEAMLVRFQTSGGKIRWVRRTDASCTLWLSHPQGGELEVTWDIERAKRAQLTASNPTWSRYPMQMLCARCVSEGIRAVYPACLSGCYTPEEVSDFADEEQPRRPSAPEAHDAVDAEVVAPPDPEDAKKPLTDEEKRFAFFSKMEEFRAKDTEAYLSKMGEIGFEKAEDVPDAQMKAVMVAVRNAVNKGGRQ